MAYQIRQKRVLDGLDKEILRYLYASKMPLTGRQIANKVKISPPAIKPRLVNLKRNGIVKPVNCGGMRNFNRIFGTKTIRIKSPSKICWALDLK